MSGALKGIEQILTVKLSFCYSRFEKQLDEFRCKFEDIEN
ncbi:hypothetical protein BFV94_4947 [Alteromonas macleodii]|jgi:hypothetical protein|uniref:Uncharacterized protein n=1 Tax=Alteromonas macleodii TaxID=28108 RepID=A0AB36FNX4_ALTMA|nr:hypothetical protein BFV93_4975 [Alteromonas macleodii]OES23997.1 hypothetical protein BFV94_4947 [Alteromonas macleodii]OES25697.1 hypothetical protein BFV95_4379 [Alteromonas macleodii]OES38891.1 hypothetical protein BFV96_4489 [Alteromonas macleodii]